MGKYKSQGKSINAFHSDKIVKMATRDSETTEYMKEHYKRALERYEIGVGDSDVYDSEEEEEILSSLTEKEKQKYEEMREVHINQLVELGRTTDISTEIRRHMFKWMPGVPSDYAARASKAMKARRSTDPEKSLTVAIPTGETIIPAEVQQTGKSTTEEDVIYIKMIPGVPGEKKPVVKEEAEEMEAAEEDETAEADDEKEEAEAIDIDEEEGKDRTPKKKEVQDALKLLEEASRQKARGYEKLRKAVPSLDDAGVEQLVSKVPTDITGHFSDSVKEFLETNEDELIRHVIAIGLYYIEQHHHHKDATYKPLRKKDIAEKFGITQRKFSEISQGISYAGGDKK